MKKPRHNIIEWTTLGEVSSLIFEVDPTSARITLLGADPTKTKLKTIYERESGKDKILTSIATNSKSSSFDTDSTLRERFDHLIAIDTNTKVWRDRRIAITTAYHVKDRLLGYSSEITFDHLCSFLVVGLEENEKAEPIGWFLTLKHKINARHFDSNTLGIVVDSELGDHDLINSRLKKFYFEYLLPQTFRFIYATDAAQDQLPNQMIRLCDKASNTIFDAIEGKLDELVGLAGGAIPGTSATFFEITPKKAEQD
jgi:hypothetical protein